ncbi:hypothetical protein SynRS9902_02137 [Synechococcus sp. RS9902]|nr:hypothetical protein SynRS9902_02137 [Synechococcus sp. RS9902]
MKASFSGPLIGAIVPFNAVHRSDASTYTFDVSCPVRL